jgi:hypothetical protein
MLPKVMQCYEQLRALACTALQTYLERKCAIAIQLSQKNLPYSDDLTHRIHKIHEYGPGFSKRHGAQGELRC